jgi:hypothetical protein
LKVRDEGKYYLLNETKQILYIKDEGYVPNELIPPKNGFGDYLDLEINEQGKIINWYEKPSFADFDKITVKENY